MKRPPLELMLEQVEDPDYPTLDYRDAPEVQEIILYTMYLEKGIELLGKHLDNMADYYVQRLFDTGDDVYKLPLNTWLNAKKLWEAAFGDIK